MRVGDYELLSRIDAGRMGEVFIARKTGRAAFEKRVALKLLLPHPSQEPELVHRFLDEARIAAQMNHPNLVQVLDVGEADGRHYLAMAFWEGASLVRLLKACQRLDEPLPLPMESGVALCKQFSVRSPRAKGRSTGVEGPLDSAPAMKLRALRSG